MYKGIFWLKDGEMLAVKVLCNRSGEPLEPCVFSSKSGKTLITKRSGSGFIALCLTITIPAAGLRSLITKQPFFCIPIYVPILLKLLLPTASA